MCQHPESLKYLTVVFITFIVTTSSTVTDLGGADLGSISKYSREALEDRCGEEFSVNSCSV